MRLIQRATALNTGAANLSGLATAAVVTTASARAAAGAASAGPHAPGRAAIRGLASVGAGPVAVVPPKLTLA